MTSMSDARRDLAVAVRDPALLAPVGWEVATEALGKGADERLLAHLSEALSPSGVHLLHSCWGGRDERAWVCALTSTWTANVLSRSARYGGLLADAWALDAQQPPRPPGPLPVSTSSTSRSPQAPWHADGTPYLYDYQGTEHAHSVQADTSGWSRWLATAGLDGTAPPDSALVFLSSPEPRGMRAVRAVLQCWLDPAATELASRPDWQAVRREETGPWQPVRADEVAWPGAEHLASLGTLGATTDDALAADVLHTLPVDEHARAAYYAQAPAAIDALARSPRGQARVTVAASRHLTVTATRWLTFDLDHAVTTALQQNPARVADSSGWPILSTVPAPPPVPVVEASTLKRSELVDPNDALDDHTWWFQPPKGLDEAGRASWLSDAAHDADRSVLVRRTEDQVLLRAAALHTDPEVRALAAANPCLPQELCSAMAGDPSLAVRVVAAGNPALPADLIAELLQEARLLAEPESLDNDFAVAFAGNSSVPAPLLLELAQLDYDVVDALLEHTKEPGLDYATWTDLLEHYEGDLEELHDRGIPALQDAVLDKLLDSREPADARLALELAGDTDYDRVAEHVVEVYANHDENMQRLYEQLASDPRITDSWANQLVQYDADDNARLALALNRSIGEDTRTDLILSGTTYADLGPGPRSLWAYRTRLLGRALLEVFAGDRGGLMRAVRALDQRADVLVWTPRQLAEYLR